MGRLPTVPVPVVWVRKRGAVGPEVLDYPCRRRLAVALALLVPVDCCPLSPLLETLSGLWLGLGRVRLSLDLSHGRGRRFGLGNRFRLSPDLNCRRGLRPWL